MALRPRFYTLPPDPIPYPFILVNANNPEPGLRYISRHRDVVESIIIDSGVEIFRNKNVREYPGGPEAWMGRLARLYRRVAALVGGAEVFVTAPDYPDDYHPRSLWLSDEKTNIERTLDNILYAIKQYKDIPWLIPVQGHYEKPKSIIMALELYEASGLLDWVNENTRYIAIANLCVSKKCSTIINTLRYANMWLITHNYSKIRRHVFGPAANCVKMARLYVDSWDSTAWTRPRSPGGSSAYNSLERVYLFITFLHRYADIIELPDLPKSMRIRVKTR